MWFRQLMSPHRRLRRMIEMLIDERTPMFAMYSRWMGETLRSTEKLRSSGLPVSARSAGTIRAGVARASKMSRNQFLTYS